jgi:hypothetical protein
MAREATWSGRRNVDPRILDPRRAQRVLGRPPTYVFADQAAHGASPDAGTHGPGRAWSPGPPCPSPRLPPARRTAETAVAGDGARRSQVARAPDGGGGRCLGWRRVPPLRLRHQAPGSGPRRGPHLPALRQHHAVGARAAGQAVHGVLRADRPVGTPAARGLRDLRHRRRGLSTVASSPVVGRPRPVTSRCARSAHRPLRPPRGPRCRRPPNPVPGDGHFSSCPPVAHRRPSDRPLGVAQGQPHRGVHCTLSRSEQRWDPRPPGSVGDRLRRVELVLAAVR